PPHTYSYLFPTGPAPSYIFINISHRLPVAVGGRCFPPPMLPPFPSRFAGPPPPPQFRCFPPPPPPPERPLCLPGPGPGRPLYPPWAAPPPGPWACGEAGREEQQEEEAGALRQHDELWLGRFLAQRRQLRPEPAAGPGARGGDRAEAGLGELARPLRERGAGLGRARQRRLRLHRRKEEARAAREEEAARAAEREAVIDRWRAKRVQEVEEKTRERELKAAADSVLSEVRKKQADTKRMAEILRGLEKLRKLRKEAAARKGVCPPPSADEAFENEIQKLKTLIKKRTELYEAEERALRVMLEGEQEEERKREKEKKQRKEREKLLQQKREMDCMLFGDPDKFPLGHLLQPFRQYYLQAEYSVPSLIQIRHEWDRYLVPADHPEGSFVPSGWVLPPLPSSDTWATALG
uniref:Programmed cell death 7 n=1 Tax=Sphenodon punctatus TaxID=8508 RepID=A0A8D0L7F0_SPHPU